MAELISNAISQLAPMLSLYNDFQDEHKAANFEPIRLFIVSILVADRSQAGNFNCKPPPFFRPHLK